jgi:hypothetical protein
MQVSLDGSEAQFWCNNDSPAARLIGRAVLRFMLHARSGDTGITLLCGAGILAPCHCENQIPSPPS